MHGSADIAEVWSPSTSRSLCAAKGDFVTSRGLHYHPDRVRDDLWLIDGHDVTGVVSDYETSSFRQGGLISLQLSPICVGSSSTGDDHDRNGEPAARGSNF